MEQKDIDIYEILKGMPDGTPLYTPMCGDVEFTSVEADKEKSRAIWTEGKNGSFSFDKVLVRNGKRRKWQPAFFICDRGEEAIYRYKVLSIQSGIVTDFPHCIPYDGNEHLAFTSDPF